MKAYSWRVFWGCSIADCAVDEAWRGSSFSSHLVSWASRSAPFSRESEDILELSEAPGYLCCGVSNGGVIRAD